MLNNQLTSNSLFHDDEEAKKRREQIYVPLALVERKKLEKQKKPDKKEDELLPEQGTKLYEPQYEEKQRFAHDTFLKDILQQKKGKTQGNRIALIGEPGAGKTTLLQTIGNWIWQQGLGLPVWVSLADLTLDGNLRSLEDYLLNSWLPFSPDKCQKVQKNFTEQFEQKRVWLLLDGVDEIATSGSQTLHNISRQLSGWVGKARVVLTCRLNVWQADVNALSDFETFRLLDFDYPQQVHQFIDNWFNPPQPFDPPQPPLGRGEQEEASQPFERAENSKGDRLKEELGKEEKARVRDLVQNPLRLALLCQSWQLHEGSLPERKAELYGQFVEQFYHWYNSKREDEEQHILKDKQEKLNQALGELAKQDIDSSRGRFRLPQDFIERILGYADDKNSMFYLALQIGWLNNVGVAAESPTEKVYAFFHATFEEYFAALAIDDWDFFLPRGHKNKPVKGRRYRIFEPQWKQVILLWLGRENVGDEKKEEFIRTLTEFKDGCKHFLPKKKLDRGFYEYRAYFLAAAGIGKFSNCTKTDEIVQKVVNWGCNFRLDKIEVAAKNILAETPRKNVINALVQLLGLTADNFTRRQPAESLGKIATGNEYAINALVQLLGSTADNFTCRQAAESLGKIATGNEYAIDALVQLLGSTTDNFTRRQAAETLGKIGTGNEYAINALLRLTAYDNFRRKTAESLGEIEPGNENAIDALMQRLMLTYDYAHKALRQLSMLTADDYTHRQAAESLGKIGTGNENAIDALVQLLGSTTDNFTRRQAAESLGKIDPGNEYAINALVQLLGSTAYDFTRRKAAESLGKIDPGNENAINALVQLLGSTTDDYTFRKAAGSLGEIGTGNENAINALVQLLGSTADNYTRRQAAETLGKIDPGNENATNALVQLLGSTEYDYYIRRRVADYYNRRQAAESLGKIDPGNENAINALVQLLGSTADDLTRGETAENLGEIAPAPGNENAINALVQLLRSTAYDFTRGKAAESLGKIDPGNENAINALVQLLGSTADKDTRRQAAESLGKIGTGNENAINALVQLLGSTTDEDSRRQAAESLGKIGTEKEIKKVVTFLKDYLSGIYFLINNDGFNQYYKIIWDCAQTLPYPEFYQAWHPPFRFKKPRWLS